MNDTISQVLDLEPVGQIPEPITIEADQIKDVTNDDYEYARKTIKDALEVGAEALGEISQVAAQSQHPRAYEVLSTLVKTIVESSRELVELKTFDRSKNGSLPTDTKITNNLFVGSTRELQNMLADLRKQDVIDNAQTS